jgi:L-threonylcarbamoyladenylate synthase
MRRVGTDRQGVAAAARLIRDGGVAAIPTDTLYGLAVDPFNPAAVARVFAAKGRPSDRALPLVASSVAQIRESLGPLSPDVERLAQMFWPGPLTLLINAPAALTPGAAPPPPRPASCVMPARSR